MQFLDVNRSALKYIRPCCKHADLILNTLAPKNYVIDFVISLTEEIQNLFL